jgi:hypothetical protein
MTMRLLIKLQGFKNLGTTEFTMTAEPSDTITAIATKLEKLTGVYADKVSVMTGLIHGNPSGSFKKLDKNATVSDNGLRHGSTLMVFIPVVGQQQQASSSPDIPIPPPIQAAPRRRTFCVGKATYRSSPSEPIKSGDIMAVTEYTGGIKKSKTTLLFEGIEYTNAQEWLSRAFNNSGKSPECMVQIERPQTVVGTPRPTRYVPPSATCKFGRYM